MEDTPRKIIRLQMKNSVAIRLLNQQLIVPQFKTPTEVVSHMGAIQAQEYRMMRWADGIT